MQDCGGGVPVVHEHMGSGSACNGLGSAPLAVQVAMLNGRLMEGSLMIDWTICDGTGARLAGTLDAG